MTKKKFMAGILAGVFILVGCDSKSNDETTVSVNSEQTVEASNDENKDNDVTQIVQESIPETAGDPQELKEISVVLDWYPNALHTFLYVASEKGYFEEEGLKLEIQFPSNTNDALSLIAAGQSDIGLYYQQDIILARANQGIPVKSIGAVVQSPLNIILSLKENNITEPIDLVGKKIGYAGTELSEALIKSMMEDVGVNYEDVTMIDVGFDLMSAMTTGNVDATIGCLVNHEVPQMEEEGFEVEFFSPSAYGVPSYYEAVFVVNDMTAENEKDMLASFLRAVQKGFDDMINDPAGSLEILLENQNAENFPLSKTVEEESMRILLPSMQSGDVKFLTQTEEIWQENIDWLTEKELITGGITPADLIAKIDY